LSKYKDFDHRKSIHVKLLTETHAAFRIELIKKKLSMQEVFEDFAQRVVRGDGFAHRVLDTIARKKRERHIERLSETDAESIFDAIEDQSLDPDDI
jgi:GTPase SAR1 family protein